MGLEAFLLKCAMALYAASLLGYLLSAVTMSRRAGTAASAAAALGLATHLAMIGVRGWHAGRVPLVNLYEYLLAFSWMVMAAYLVFERRCAERAAQMRMVGGLSALLTLGLIGCATSLPSSSRQIETLMPVLKSNWLALHVFTAVVGYGAAALASVLALLYFVSRGAAHRAPWLSARLPNPEDLDAAVSRAVRFAFPFLTLVNVTGAIWAYDAWGRYWGWDPKETWSLITWFVYVFYLHARSSAGWRGPRTNAVALVGFAAVMFTLLAVNKLGVFAHSLHSYASGG